MCRRKDAHQEHKKLRGRFAALRYAKVAFLLVSVVWGLYESATAQPLRVSVTKLNDYELNGVVNEGHYTQPVTNGGVAVFHVQSLRHTTRRRLNVTITVPTTFAAVSQWRVAYSRKTNTPRSATTTLLNSTFTLNSNAESSSPTSNIYFYVYTDVTYGSMVANYTGTITLSATLSPI